MKHDPLTADHMTINLKRHRLKFLACFLMLFSMLFASATAFGEGGQKVREHADLREGKQESKTSAVVVDKSGSMIMTGYTNSGGTDDDIWTVKFNADVTDVYKISTSPDVYWRAQYGHPAGGSDRGLAIALDMSDNIIITGYVWNGINKDIQTIKYCNNSDPNQCKTNPGDATGKKQGEIIWKHTYHPSGNRNAMGIAIATDDNNDIYIGGNIANGGSDDYIIIKYKASGPNTEGSPVWVTTYNGPDGYTDKLASLAVGKDSNKEYMVVVTGASATKTAPEPTPLYRFDAFTKIYNASDGTERKNGSIPMEWRYQTVKDSAGKKVLIDGNGNVIVTCSSGSAEQTDIYTAKYNATTGSATPTWAKIELQGKNKEPSAMVIDEASGDVIVTGSIFTAVGNDDVYAVRYKGSNGDKVWAQQETIIDSEPGSGSSDYPTSIILDKGGDIYIGGYSVTTTGLDRFMAIKLAGSSGTPLWKSLEGPIGRDARSTGIGLANSWLLVGGWAYLSATDYDYYMIAIDAGKINPPSDLNAKTILDPEKGLSIQLTWVNNATSPIAGFIVERKGGGVDWAPVADIKSPTTICNDTALVANTTYYYRVKAYDADNATSNPSVEAHALALIVTEKAPAWRYTYGGTSSFNDFAKSIAVGPDNHPVVTGYVTNLATNELYQPINTYDYFTTKLNRVGSDATKTTTSFWSKIYDDENSQADVAVGVVVDSTNASYVTGYSLLATQLGAINSIFTMKYSDDYVEGGTPPPKLLWEAQYNGPFNINDKATTVASAGDGSNSIAVVGYGYNGTYKDRDDETGYTVVYLIKYLANPELGEGITAPSEWSAKQNRLGPPVINVAYDGGTGDAFPSAVVFDKKGNVLVTGYVQNRTFNAAGKTIAKDFDIFTAKYCGSVTSDCPSGKNPGDMIWMQRYNGLDSSSQSLGKDDKGQSIAIDLSNNVYITGSTTNADGNIDIITIKYCGSAASNCPDGKNPGDMIWKKTYDGLAHGDDFGVSVRYDQADDTIVIGGTTHTAGTYPPPVDHECSGDHDFIVIRYDANGNVAKNIMGKDMITVLPRPDNDEVAKDMVMDITGNVTLVGYTTDLARSSSDAISVKFDYELNLVAATIFDAKTTAAPIVSLQSDDEATTATVNFLGEVFVAGYTTNAAGNADFLAYKMEAPLLQVCAPFTVQPFYTKIDLTWTDTSTSEPQPLTQGYAGSSSDTTGTKLQDNLQTSGAFWEANVYVDDYLLITSVASPARNANIGQYKKITANTVNRLITVASAFPVAIGAGDGYSIIHNPTDTTHNGEDGFYIERKLANGIECNIADPPGENGWSAIPDYQTNISHNNSVGKAVSYSDPGLSTGSTYCYRIRSHKTGQPDNRWVMRRVVLDAPQAPINLTATPINTTRIDLSWQTKTSGDTGYKIYRCESAPGDACVIPDKPVTPATFELTGAATTFSDTTVENNKKYGYRVFSYINDPVSGWQSPLSTQANTTTPAAVAPTVSSVTPVNNGLVTINWNATTNNDKTGYKIRRCEGNACTETDFADNPASGTPVSPAYPLKNPVGIVGPDKITYDDTLALKSDIQYSYEVCAYKTATIAWEKCSAPTAAITTTSTAPSLISATPVTGSSSDITVTWSDTTGSETNFIIERCDDTKTNCDVSQAFNKVGVVAAGTTSWTDTTVCRNTTYTYRIWAVNRGLSNDSSTLIPGTWAYRAPLDFGANFKANALAQVSIDMIPGKMKADFSDLRIFDESTQKELQYIFGSKNAAIATLVFQTGATNSLVLYYGNPNAILPFPGISDPNLAGYWPFKENYNATPNKTADISGKGNTLDLVGFTAPTGIRVISGGNAISFTGTSYVVKSPVNSTPSDKLDLTTNFTLMGWVYPKAAQLGGILDRGQEGKSAWELWYNADKSFSFTQNMGQAGNGTLKTAINSVPLNQWTHVAAVYTNNSVKLYLNGVEVASKNDFSNNPITSSSDWLEIGANRPGTTDKFFNGLIDEVRIYNVNMSADDVFGHFSARFGSSPSMDTGLVGYWPFEENLGIPAQTADASGNGNDLTPTNSTIVAGGVVSGEETLSFNGSGIYAITNTPSADLNLTSNFTLMGWINPQGGGGILDRGNETGSAWELWYDGTNKKFGYAHNWRQNNSLPWESAYTANNTVPLNTWTHVAAVFTNKKVTLYVNGVASGTPVDLANNPVTTGADWFEIGANRPGSDEFFNGLVDEIRIYKSALSAPEVLAIASQATPITGTLQAEQNFSGTFSSAWSDLKSTNTKQALANNATPPNTLTATVFSETQINLNWLNNSTTVAEASGIKIMRCTAGIIAGCSNYAQLGPDLPSNTTSFNDIGLTPNNYYSYKVVTFKNVACTSWNHDNSTVESNTVVDVKTTPVAPTWIVVDTKAVVASECEDIRFTKNDGTTLLIGQWAKKSTCGSTSPNIWTKVQGTIPANSTQTIYYYYGNPAAPSINSGSNTFDLYDEFNGTVIDSSNWVVVGSHYSQNNALISSGGSGNWDEGIYSVANFARPFIFEVEHFQTGGNYMMIGAKNTGTNVSYTDYTNAIYPVYDGGGNRDRVYEDSQDRGDKKTGILPNAWQYYKLELLATGANYYYGAAPDTYTNIYTSTYSSTSPLKVGFPNASQAFKLDNARVRKYASVVPTLTVGTKEYGTWTVDGQTFKARIPVAIAYTGTTPLNDFQLQLPAFDTTPLQSDRVTLTWTDPTSTETGFTVQRCTGTTDCSVANFTPTVTFDKNNTNAGISGQLQPQLGAGSAVIFNDRTVAANTNYCYRVKPDLPTGEILYTGVVCKTTSLPKGMLNENISFTTSGSQVNLTWNDYTSNEDGFILERCSNGPCVDDVDNHCTNCDNGFPLILAQHAGGTTAIPTTVTWSDNSTCTNSTYNYRVKSIKPWVADWPSDYSISKSVPVQPALAPISVTATRASETQINLTWSYASADETVMQIWRCTGDSTVCTADKFFQVGSDLAKGSAPYYKNNTYSDAGLTPNTTYTYQVRAAKYAATCPWTSISALSAAHIETASTTAAPPTAFTAIPTNSTLVNLSFTDAAVSDSGLKIQRCSGAGCSDFSDLKDISSSSLVQRTYKAFYTFNNTLNDSSGNNLHLTKGAGALAYEDGGLAMDTGTWFQSATTSILDNDYHAIEFDMKIRNTYGNWAKIFGYNAGGSDRSPGIWVWPSDTHIHWRYDPGNTDGAYSLGVNADNGTAFTVGTWYHIRGEKSGSNFKAYVNGVKVQDVNIAANPKTPGATPLWFGGANVTIKNFSIESNVITYAKNSNVSVNDDSVCSGNTYNYRIVTNSNFTSDGGLGTNWTNYIPLTIANFQPFFQTRVTIPWNSKMKADFSDIRFYDATSKAVLPYWIESKTDGSTAMVWFKTSGNNNVNLYYGNPNAVSASSGSSVFDFFDDFKTLNTSVWNKSHTAADITVDSSGSGTLRVNNGALTSNAPIVTTTQNSVFEMKNRWTGASGGASAISIADTPYIQSMNAGTNAKVENRISSTASSLNAIATDGTTASYNLGNVTYSTTDASVEADRIVGFEFRATTDISFFSKDPSTYVDKGRTNIVGTWNKPAYLMFGYPFGINSALNDGWDMIVDWIRVRKYAATEPDVTLGIEQPPSIATPINDSTMPQWSRKVPISISNFQPNFSTKVIIPSSIVANRTAAQLKDLRFRDETAGTELPNWVEKVMADGTALVWIRTGANNNVMMYYGNSAAISNGNGSEVFTFFEDFNYASLTDTGFTDKWTVENSTGFKFTGSALRGTNTTGRIISKATFSSGVIQEIKANSAIRSTDGAMMGGFFPSWANSFGWLNHGGVGIYDNKGVWTNMVGLLPINTPMLYSVAVKNSTTINPKVTYYDTDSVFQNIGDLTNSVSNAPIAFGRRYDEYGSNQSYFTDWDWVRVRSYAATEPSGTVTIASDIPNPLYASVPSLSPGTGGSGTWTTGVPLSIANFQPNFATRMSIPPAITAAMKSDLSDLRFYDTVAGAELKHWVETKAVDTGSSPSSPLSNAGGGIWTQKQRLLISNYKRKFLTRVVIPANCVKGMKSDLSDLRFYDFTAGAELPYWIQGISTSSPANATVWLKTGDNDANTITMYYGNLSASAVNSRDSVFGSGLVGYWPFEEPANTTLGTTADVSGNGMTGTLTNTPTIVSGSIYGNGLSLTGTSSNYVNIPDTGYPNSPLDITGSVSIEAWYYYDGSNQSGNRLAAKLNTDNSATMYGLFVDTGGFMRFLVKSSAGAMIATDSLNHDNSVPGRTLNATPTLSVGWHHIVGTYNIIDSSTAEIAVYIDGVKDVNGTTGMTTSLGTNAATPVTIGVFNTPLTIGSNAGVNYFLTGKIDEFRLYNRALTSADIASRYAANPPVAMAVGTPPVTNNPTVWLKTGTNNNIMMFYGNSVAASVSNPNAVFDFFEDFTSLDVSQPIAIGNDPTSHSWGRSIAFVNIVKGTAGATGNSTTTLQDDFLSSNGLWTTTDYYKNYYLLIMAVADPSRSANTGQFRKITANSTGRLISTDPANPFPAAIGTGDTYQIIYDPTVAVNVSDASITGTDSMTLTKGSLYTNAPVINSSPINHVFEMKNRWTNDGGSGGGLTVSNSQFATSGNGNTGSTVATINYPELFFAHADLRIGTGGLQAIGGNGAAKAWNVGSPMMTNDSGAPPNSLANVINKDWITGIEYRGANDIYYSAKDPTTYTPQYYQKLNNTSGSWTPIYPCYLTPQSSCVSPYASPEIKPYIFIGHIWGYNGSTGYQNPINVDWVRVRGYAANEPVVTFGVEQSFSGFTNGNGQLWSTGAPLTFTSFQANAPARVVIPAATLGAMKTDLSDLRFYDTATKSELPYWVEIIYGSPATAVVWLKTGASSSIYMYYGNPSATSVSNKNAVFGTRALTPATGMFGFWPFEEDLSGSTPDYSGNNLSGALTSFTSGYGVVSDGMFGNALKFDGTNGNYVNVPSTAPLNITGSATIELWYKHNPITALAWACVLCKSDPTPVKETYGIWVNNTNQIVAIFQPSSGGQLAQFGGDVLTTGTWNHIVGRYDYENNKMAIFINGAKFESGMIAHTTLYSNNEPLTIGKSRRTDFFNSITGSVDEVRIYNRALTDAEIATRISPPPTIGTAFQVQPVSTWVSTYSNVVTVVTPDAGNVVTDPSFENGSTTWGTATNISYEAPAYSGAYSLKVKDNGYLTKTVTVVPNTVYKLSGYLKNGHTSGNPQCDVYNASPLIDSPGISVPKGTTDWTYREEYVTIPAGATTVAVRCFADGTTPTGSSWFDMVQLTSQGGNMVKNPNFDNGATSWTLGSTAATVDSTTATANGSNSSMMISTSAKTNSTLAINTQEIVSQALPALTPGLSYTLTGNIKANLTNGYAFCRLALNNDPSWDNPGVGSPEFDLVSDSNMIIWAKNDNTIPAASDTTGTNGRLPLGSSAGTGDVGSVVSTSVVPDGSLYKMWYSGGDTNNAGTWRVYYATSPDGLNWTKKNNAKPANSDIGGVVGSGQLPLGTATGSGASNPTFIGDGAQVFAPSVVKDIYDPAGQTFKMWYAGHDGINWRIYYAYSTDGGLTWIKKNNKIEMVSGSQKTQDSSETSTDGRLYLGSIGKGDSGGAYTPKVIQDLYNDPTGQTFKMWYAGYDGTSWRIFYAISTDRGLTWTKQDNSIPAASDGIISKNADNSDAVGNGRIPLGTNGTTPMGGSLHVLAPTIWQDGANSYKMWYSGQGGPSSWTGYNIFYATSTDGLVWTKQNDNKNQFRSDVNSTGGRIFNGNTGRGEYNQIYYPVVIKDGPTYKMWHTGTNGGILRIYYATLANNIDTTSNKDNQWHSFSLPVTIKPSLSTSDAALLRVVCGIARDDSGNDGLDTAWFDMIQVAASTPSFNLTATRASETQINLAWSDLYTDETGYNIERCSGVSCSNFSPIVTLAANTTSYNDLGLVPGTNYSYRITAYKTAACGWTSNYSNIATAQTSFASLVTPASPILTVTSVPDAGHVNLSWTNTVTGQAGFEIERCTGAGCSFLCADAACSYPTTSKIASVTSGTTFGDSAATQLNGNTTYSYRIRAYNAADANGKYAWNGAYSNVATATTTVGATAISTTTLSGTVANTTQINLDWMNTLSNESGYKIERCTGSNCTFSTIDPGFPMYVGPNFTNYNDTTVCNGSIIPSPPGPPYSYRIYAANENGPSNSGGGSWSRRAKVNISDFQANLPIRMTVDRPAAMKTTYEDIRFIDTGTGVELPYWIEQTTAAANGYPDRATVWIKTGTTTAIYLYYGNANALSASSVTGVFGSNLVGYWPFNETAGAISGSSADYSGNGLTATINNGVLPYGVVSAGRYKNGLSLNGSTTSATVADTTTNSPLDITGSLTLETWYQYQTSSAWSRIISKPTVGGAQPWDLYGIYLNDPAVTAPVNQQQPTFVVCNTNQWTAPTAPPIGECSYSPTGPNLVPGTWYHVVGKRDSGTGETSLFVNGVKYPNTGGKFSIPGSNEALGIGNWGGRGNNVKGVIDEVRLYNRALPDSEIVSHYAAIIPTVAGFGAEESANASNSTVSATVVNEMFTDDSSIGPNATWTMETGHMWREINQMYNPALPKTIDYTDSQHGQAKAARNTTQNDGVLELSGRIDVAGTGSNYGLLKLKNPQLIKDNFDIQFDYVIPDEGKITNPTMSNTYIELRIDTVALKNSDGTLYNERYTLQRVTAPDPDDANKIKNGFTTYLMTGGATAQTASKIYLSDDMSGKMRISKNGNEVTFYKMTANSGTWDKIGSVSNAATSVTGSYAPFIQYLSQQEPVGTHMKVYVDNIIDNLNPSVINETFASDATITPSPTAIWTLETGHWWAEQYQTLVPTSPKFIDYADTLRGQSKVSINSTTNNSAVNPFNSSALEFVTSVPNPVPDSGLTGITGPNYAMLYMNTPEVLKDEYDILLDYSIPADGYIADNLPASPKARNYYARLRIDSPSDGFAGNQFIIERSTAQDPNDGNKYKNCYLIQMTSGGAPAIVTVVPTTDTSGTLRINKIGNVVNFYKNPIGNSTWGTPLASLSNANHMPPTTLLVMQQLGFGEQPGTRMRTLVDNIKITRPNTSQYSYGWNYSPASSGYSNVVANLVPTTPQAVTGVTATALTSSTGASDSQIDVSWANSNTDQTGFKVWKCTPVAPAITCVPDYNDVPFKTVVAANSFTASGLQPSTNYCFSVKAYKSVVCRWDSAPSTVAASSCDKTGAATPVIVNAAAVGSYKIALTWEEASTDASGFDIQVKIFGGSWNSVGTANGTARTYVDSIGIEPSKAYTYRIRNYRDIAGQRDYSPYSNEITATTPADTQGGNKTCR